MTDSEDDTYTIPLQDQRVFGAGIKRKRINFVPAENATIPKRSTTTNVADLYLSVVMKEKSSVGGERAEEGVIAAATATATEPSSTLQTTSQAASTTASTAEPTPEPQTLAATNEGEPNEKDEMATAVSICEICNYPILPTGRTGTPHESSLAHQLSLQHSHPPSSIDRTRKGLPILQASGWDPDSRLGLGAHGDGILHPLKPKPKNNTAGLGLDLKSLSKAGATQKAVAKKLNAKEARDKAEEDKRKAEILQRSFYRNEDVEKYLGKEANALLVMDQQFSTKRRGKKR